LQKKWLILLDIEDLGIAENPSSELVIGNYDGRSEVLARDRSRVRKHYRRNVYRARTVAKRKP
jgi:hypothetical protein